MIITFCLILLVINVVWLDVIVFKRRTPKRPKDPCTIVPSDAASALVHKALKHLVEGCEDHMAVCPYQEGSLSGLISFSKEVLSRDMTSNGIMRMANLEERLLEAQAKYNELLEQTKKECICGKGQCQQHPGTMPKM